MARVDLNGDGIDEFIVQSAEPYSGGPMMEVFERRDNSFAEIADVQGVVYLAPRVNGYFEIVGQSRAGAGGYTRTLQRYEQGHYALVRIADYRESEAGGPLVFVRERPVLRRLGAHHPTFLTEVQMQARDLRLRQLRDIREGRRESPTLRDFLGGQPSEIAVTQLLNSSLNREAAHTLIDELMRSALVQPNREGPFESEVWSELAVAAVIARIEYTDGRMGQFETDGRAHAYFEDHDGLGWWYRFRLP